jgi:hypothetical protein
MIGQNHIRGRSCAINSAASTTTGSPAHPALSSDAPRIRILPQYVRCAHLPFACRHLHRRPGDEVARASRFDHATTAGSSVSLCAGVPVPGHLFTQGDQQ